MATAAILPPHKTDLLAQWSHLGSRWCLQLFCELRPQQTFRRSFRGGHNTRPFRRTSDHHCAPLIGGCLQLYANQWELITMDMWVLNTIRHGLTLEFLSQPPRTFIRCLVPSSPLKQELLHSVSSPQGGGVGLESHIELEESEPAFGPQTLQCNPSRQS